MKTLLEFDYRKATQAINYFIGKDNGLTYKLKVIKLIYFADRYHLRKFGRPIMNDTYFAMPKGPVASSVKDIIEFSTFLAEEERVYAQKFLKKGDFEHSIISQSNTDFDVFSNSEIEALNFSAENFGETDVYKLVEITHIYPEWQKFRTSLEIKGHTRENMSYEDFFENPTDQSTFDDKFKISAERLKISKETFEDHYKIAEFWK